MVRYADDFVVLSCKTARRKRKKPLPLIQCLRERERPDPAPRTKPISGIAGIKGQGFEFLGYHFEAGLSVPCGREVCPRLRGQGQGQDQPDERPKPRPHDRGRSTPRSKGRFGYFKHATFRPVQDVDAFVCRGCGDVAQVTRHKRPVFAAAAPEDRRRWPNAFFASGWAVHPRHSLAGRRDSPDE